MEQLNTCGHPDRKHHKDGQCYHCHYYAAHREDYARGYAAKRGAVKERRLFYLYGITPEEYKAALSKGCDACGRPFSIDSEAQDAPMVDHDHNCCDNKNRVTCGACRRGVICKRCNTVLGLLEEDARLLPAYLIEYLKKFGKRKIQW